MGRARSATLFPELIHCFSETSTIKRGIDKQIIFVHTINIRDFSTNKHKNVDDYPYGGGPGMVMCIEPIYSAFNHLKLENKKTIYFSPCGRKLTDQLTLEYSREKNLFLLCGHYEGVDQRVIDNLIDDEISMGDYILSGGEIPAMAFIDSVSRKIDGFINQQSLCEESFSTGLLEYSQYTRPRIFNGWEVPEVLLNGHHKQIEEWRYQDSVQKTKLKRPDLLPEKQDKI